MRPYYPETNLPSILWSSFRTAWEETSTLTAQFAWHWRALGLFVRPQSTVMAARLCL